MVARVVPQSARRRHAESRKPDLRGRSAGGRWPVLPAGAPGGWHLGCQSNAAAPDTRGCLGGKRVMPASLATMLRKLELEIRSISACVPLLRLVRRRCPSRG